MLPEKVRMASVCMDSSSTQYFSVLVAAKLGSTLAYHVQHGQTVPNPGSLVRVPMGHRTLTGLVIEECSPPQGIRTKPIEQVLDVSLDLPESLVVLLQWCSRYYHCSGGQVLTAALPKKLLSGSLQDNERPDLWITELTAEHIDTVAAPRQRELLDWLSVHGACSRSEIHAAGFGSHLIRALEQRGLIKPAQTEADNQLTLLAEPALHPNSSQQSVLDRIHAGVRQGIRVFLLDGVTGSGKTEIYMQAMEPCLTQARQVLYLVPEIGLVEQTLRRLRRRFQVPIHAYHSDTTEREKMRCWRAAKSGKRLIIVGTRSAVFLPLTKLGLLVVDEEQDLSYKQQEGFRYNARDLAVVRARDTDAQLILGSATPSIESLHNATRGQYEHLCLDQRVEQCRLPDWSIVHRAGSTAPLTAETVRQIEQVLENSGQVLIFVNRRGFAPVLQCADCGWRAICKDCDLSLTIHTQPPLLICHRCDRRERIARSCVSCGSLRLESKGLGTEQVESYLQARFPSTPCVRIDRDSTRRKGSFRAKMDSLSGNQPAILVGTQMITKGHHLPGISLVVTLNADTALYSHDYRAMEHLAQTLIQAGGRAGRGETQGRIIVETSEPDHPLMQKFVHNSYREIAGHLLQQRLTRKLPPQGRAAIFHATSQNLATLIEFMRGCSAAIAGSEADILGPLPATPERIKKRFRYQIQLYARRRVELHNTLARLETHINSCRRMSTIRWSIDVDPLTMD